MPRRLAMLLVPAALAALGAGFRQLHGARAERLPVYRDAALTPEWSAEGPEHRVADFALVDQAGDTGRARDLDGRVHVASFFYASCTRICRTTRGGLAAVRDAFRGDPGVVLLSFSVTPQVDSVAALRAYARAHGIASGQWHLLTGDAAVIRALARDSYFARLEEDNAGSFLHSETFFLVDGRRRIRGVYNGTLRLDVERLVEDIRRLKEEARGTRRGARGTGG
jgi:protein SCO1